LATTLAATDELCVCDVAWVSGRAENLVSHHLRQLRAAGLVTSRRDGKMVLYAMTARGRALLDVLNAELPSAPKAA
jgi:DNA-binding transcriptional ArsR family regulator